MADNNTMAMVSAMESISPPAEADPGVDGPLSPEHQQELSEAARRARKVTGAVRVATFNGWCTGVFAGLSLVCAVFSVTALVVGIGLTAVAWNEFRGRNLLRWFDQRGPWVLGWNQLAFLGLLVGYSLWSLWVNLTGPNPYETYVKSSPELASMLGPVDQLHSVLVVAVYGGVIVLSLLFQGLNAIYYFSRTRHLQHYLSHTPPWIVQMQRRWAR